MKVYHLNILATKEDRDELNRVGWDGHPRFQMHADITLGMGERWKPAVEAAFSEGAYKFVCSMADDFDLEDAFRLTNHIEAPWTANEGLSVAPGGHRSTSVGDVIERAGKFYAVASIGFVEVLAK